MIPSILNRRRSQREALLRTAREWAKQAGPTLGAETVVVVGSVARGDFNKWSDIDVLVIASGLPDAAQERWALVAGVGRPPGVQPILWTPDELKRRRAAGTDPLAAEAYTEGVVVFGELQP